MTLPAIPPRDADRVQALAVVQALDLDLARLVGLQPGEHAPGLVDGVAAVPGARGVRRHAARQSPRPAACRCSRPRSRRPSAPAGRRSRPRASRARAGDPAEAVALRLDLLAVVEDVGDVTERLGQRRRHPSCTATPPFMSTVPRPTQQVPLAPGREVRRRRGTVSMWPASTTRSGRPRAVRATTALPSRITSRWPSAAARPRWRRPAAPRRR